MIDFSQKIRDWTDNDEALGKLNFKLSYWTILLLNDYWDNKTNILNDSADVHYCRIYNPYASQEEIDRYAKLVKHHLKYSNNRMDFVKRFIVVLGNCSVVSDLDSFPIED